jgi:hypothetical protein
MKYLWKKHLLESGATAEDYEGQNPHNFHNSIKKNVL